MKANQSANARILVGLLTAILTLFVSVGPSRAFSIPHVSHSSSRTYRLRLERIPQNLFLQRRGRNRGFGPRARGGGGGRGARPPAYETVPGDTINPAPAIGSNGLVYVTSWNDDVYALDSRTGAVVWKFATARQINASPALGPDGTVYVCSFDHCVYALDGKTGAQKWRFLTGDVLDTSPAVDKSGTVFVGGNDSWIYALDGKTGGAIWRFKTLGAVSTPVVAKDGSVYAGADRIYAFNGKTGAVQWIHPLVNDATTPVAVGGGVVYVADHEGDVTALDQKTGAVEWQREITGDAQYMPCVTDREVVVASDRLYALRPGTGTMCWSYGDNGDQWSSPVPSGSRSIVAGSDDGGLYSVDSVTGDCQWRFDTDDPMISFPAVASDGTVYISCEGNGLVYALDGRSGKPKWKFTEDPVPPAGASPTGIRTASVP